MAAPIKEEFVSVGRIVATHGVRGDIIIAHQLGNNKKHSALNNLLLGDGRGGMLPYFIKQLQVKSEDEWMVLFEDIDSKEKARPLLKRIVYMPVKQFDEMVSASSTLGILHYNIVENKKVLGRIESLIEQPAQIIAVIYMNDREVLIPLHEKSLLSVDRKRRIVNVTLPEGLVDLYLG